MGFKGHVLYDELVAIGAIDPSAIEPYYPRVRDREDVGVMRCARSGVVFLDRIDHVSENYYSDQEGLNYWSKEGREAGLKETGEDDRRRAALIRDMVKGKVYADVGTGLGGILDLVKDDVKEAHAVEPQRNARNMLTGLGYRSHASTADLAASGTRCDVVTLFHVFEHLVEPLAELERIHEALRPGGVVVIEVPHARDALLSLYDLDAFKRFTFWSEHLVLHTHASLDRYLEKAGFSSIHVRGIQRYPLANHLYWLKAGMPGGQNHWPQLRDAKVEEAYARLLDRNSLSDTLLATAVRA